MVPVSSIQTSWSNYIFWSVLSCTRKKKKLDLLVGKHEYFQNQKPLWQQEEVINIHHRCGQRGCLLSFLSPKNSLHLFYFKQRRVSESSGIWLKTTTVIACKNEKLWPLWFKSVSPEATDLSLNVFFSLTFLPHTPPSCHSTPVALTEV